MVPPVMLMAGSVPHPYPSLPPGLATGNGPVRDVGTMRILVVDDEVQIRAFLKTLLGRRTSGRAHVDDCGSAEEALRALHAHEYDLIISDYKMGAMNGIDLLEAARSRYPGMARILMTAFDDAEIATQAVERCAVDGFVSKPFNSKHVQTLVEGLLKQTTKAPAGAPPAPTAAAPPPAKPAAAPAAPVPPGREGAHRSLNPVEAREEIVRIDHALRHLRVQFGLGRLSSEAYRQTTEDLLSKKARLEVWLLQHAPGGA